ncbi:MAG: peptidylprolyl isomerase [Ilumatobacteraceae bacterium]
MVTVVVVAAVAAVTSGCRTFTDNEVVARVGDDELTASAFDAAASDAAREDAGDRTIGGRRVDRVARRLRGACRQRHPHRRGGSRAGTGGAHRRRDRCPAGVPRRAAGRHRHVDREPNRSRDGAVPWALRAGIRGERRRLSLHHRRPVASGRGVGAGEFDGTPEGFAELARASSADESAQNGGSIGCQPLSQLSSAPDLAEAVVTTEIGSVAGPLQLGEQFYLIYIQPFEVARSGLGGVFAGERFSALAADAAVYVDPRYGRFDPEAVGCRATRPRDTGLVVPPGVT